jgi:hypothetical protein
VGDVVAARSAFGMSLTKRDGYGGCGFDFMTTPKDDGLTAVADAPSLPSSALALVLSLWCFSTRAVVALAHR